MASPEVRVICEAVEKVELLRAKQRQSEKELEELFQNLMQKAFRGKLVQPFGGINSESVDEGEECVNPTPLNPPSD
jgi:hypothetical protein